MTNDQYYSTLNDRINKKNTPEPTPTVNTPEPQVPKTNTANTPPVQYADRYRQPSGKPFYYMGNSKLTGVEEYKPPRPKVNSFDSNNLGIRDAMNAAGLDDKKIGWDGENVTYDGKYFLTPSRNDDGVTKTNTNNLMTALNGVLGEEGASMVDVTKYVSSNTGLGNLVEYGSDGSISLGGIQIPNTVIIDGQAYARSSDIANVVKQYKQSSGYQTQTDVFKGYLDKYADDISRTTNAVKNWKYNPEDDPAYQAYKEMYTRNGAEARDNTYGSLAARTGGYGNSAAIAASAGAYNDYMKQLNDKIPELAMQDYARKMDELNLYGSPAYLYGRQANAAYTDTNMVQAALTDDYNRNVDSKKLQYDYQVFQDDRDQRAWGRGQADKEWEYRYKTLEGDNAYRDAMLAQQTQNNMATQEYNRRQLEILEKEAEDKARMNAIQIATMGKEAELLYGLKFD